MNNNSYFCNCINLRAQYFENFQYYSLKNMWAGMAT